MLANQFKRSITKAGITNKLSVLNITTFDRSFLRLKSTKIERKISNPTKLTWFDFFKLRKTERRINVGSSIFTALVGCNISWGYLSNMQIDPTQMIFGFDPIVVISGALIASGALGYLFGPLIGSQMFKVSHSKQIPDYNDKNKEFLQHIIQNRVDASSQSFSNPVPDYYGEKIGSMKEYRQWLRDCHKYARKAKEFL